jgi:hypothetical protein
MVFGKGGGESFSKVSYYYARRERNFPFYGGRVVLRIISIPFYMFELYLVRVEEYGNVAV